MVPAHRRPHISIPSNRGLPSDPSAVAHAHDPPSTSQSPQIGACLRTKEVFTAEDWDSLSQSPQIGACLRTHGCLPWSVPHGGISIPSNRGLPSDAIQRSRPCPRKNLNPLKSGPAFGPKALSLKKRKARESQSPQIGACLRTMAIPLSSKKKSYLNPLKSGPAFGPDWDSLALQGILVSQSPQIGACLRTSSDPIWSFPFLISQSPQIGACLRTQDQVTPKASGCQISIPSNRGLPSDLSRTDIEQLARTSQSPQIGACLRTVGAEPHRRCRGRISIPSNRGLPSDAAALKAAAAMATISIPSNRGLPSDPC